MNTHTNAHNTLAHFKTFIVCIFSTNVDANIFKVFSISHRYRTFIKHNRIRETNAYESHEITHKRDKKSKQSKKEHLQKLLYIILNAHKYRQRVRYGSLYLLLIWFMDSVLFVVVFWLYFVFSTCFYQWFLFVVSVALSFIIFCVGYAGNGKKSFSCTSFTSIIFIFMFIYFVRWFVLYNFIKCQHIDILSQANPYCWCWYYVLLLWLFFFCDANDSQLITILLCQQAFSEKRKKVKQN